MEIKQLEYMTTAADVGSFNKASEILYTTQSNVSKVIKGLEKELGYTIFRRQGNGVVLTDAGKILYDSALEILGMLRRIDSYTEIANKTCFHIACVPSNYIASNFADFVGIHDNDGLCFKMWDGTMSYVMDLVDKREAELGFFYLNDRQCDLLQPLLKRKGLVYEKMIPGRLEICIGPKHPYFDRNEITEDELKGLKYVCTAEDNLSKTYHLPKVEKGLHLEEEMSSAVEVGSSYALMNILLNTDRTDLCYGMIFDGEQEGIGGVKTIPVIDHGNDISLGYIHKEDTPISDLAKKFIRRISRGYSNME